MKKIAAIFLILIIALTLVFLYGGDSPGLQDWNPESEDTVNVVRNDETVKEKIAESTQTTEESKNQPENDSSTSYIEEPDKYSEEQDPEEEQFPIEFESTITTDEKLTCTLTVRCDTILDNISSLDREKANIVPKDGVIFAEKAVTFYEGESVFDLLLREMKLNKIHIEFVNTPMYDSAYIEGIANLYEFDCGKLSGWIYKVNGKLPNYGCSCYLLKAGDNVEWVYTCNSGVDVGR